MAPILLLFSSGICLPVFDNIASVFKTAMAIMNPITIATFLNKIFAAIFHHLLAASSIEGGLIRLMFTYFGTVETNRKGMLHFYYLVWLKKMAYLSNFWQKICSDFNYLNRLLYFLDYICTTSLSVYFSDLSLAQDPGQDKFTLLPIIENIDTFCITLVADLNKVTSKIKMYFLSNNCIRRVRNMTKTVLDAVSIFLNCLLKKDI